MSASFLWYDLETFGRDPRRARIAQFAAIRTDLDLNPVFGCAWLPLSAIIYCIGLYPLFRHVPSCFKLSVT